MFKAHDPVLNKTVALKFLNNDTWNEEEFLRFQREARALAKLNHPGIGSILDFGINERGQPYMVLDLIEGVDLACFSKDMPLPLPDAISIMNQVCEALSHAHSKGIVHRDIKPSNIIIRRDENNDLHAILIDFGIAKIVGSEEQFSTVTKAGAIVGSPLYISPEQIRNESITAQSDIYSLGCVLYFMLRGDPPFRGETALATISMHLNDSPPPFPTIDVNDVTASIEAIIKKCLEKKPAMRFHTASALYEALSSVPLQAVSFEVQKSNSAEQTSRAKSSARIYLLIVGGLVTVGVMTTMMMVVLKSWLDNQSLPSVDSDTRVLFDERERAALPSEAPESLMKTSYEMATHGMFMWNEGKGKLSILGHATSNPKADIDKMTRILKTNKLDSLVVSSENLPLLPKTFLHELQKQPELRDLELIQFTDTELASFVPLPKLIVLRITSSRFKGTTLKSLSRFASLKRVCLNGCQRINGEYLKDLSAINGLDAVELTGAYSIQKSDFIELARLPIQFLKLNDSRYQAIDLTQLLKTRTIKSLNLKNTNVTDMDVRLLQNIRTLRMIDLTNCINVSPDTVSKIPKRINVIYKLD